MTSLPSHEIISSSLLSSVKNVAVLAGGWSGEREVSLSSGQGIYDALQQSGKYKQVTLIDVKMDLPQLLKDLTAAKPDVIVNALHGIGGEDGVIQGVLEMLNLPYTHSGVEGSVLGMDKVASRILFVHAGIPVPTWELCTPEKLLSGHRPFPFPWVVKPRADGSSLGVSLVKTPEDVTAFCSDWCYGPEVLVETYIKGKELETAVFEGQSWGTLEVRPHAEFFDYTSKYTPGAAEHVMPADIPADVYQRVGLFAEKAYTALGCRGVARVEFIYDEQAKEVYLLELNSQPGFTSISLVPEAARYNGLSYLDVIEKMMESALQHFQEDHHRGTLVQVAPVGEEVNSASGEKGSNESRRKKSSEGDAH